MKNNIIEVQNVQINVTNLNEKDYIYISDIAKAKSDKSRAADVIRNWLRNRSTLDFLTAWEQLYNPNFKVFESEHFKKQVGLLTFTLSVSEWCERTNAIGMYSKMGKYGGTYAHKDIAFEFAMWISPEFKIYVVKEFQRLKEEELKFVGWSAKRELSKINYHIHTDAIKNNLIPKEITSSEANVIYANEADVLNVALFGKTAKMWKDENPDLKGNVRDYASIEQLIVLINLESMNSELIKTGKSQSERALYLNKMAIEQLTVLYKYDNKLLNEFNSD